MLTRKLFIALLIAAFVVPAFVFPVPASADDPPPPQVLIWIWGDQSEVTVNVGDGVYLVTGWGVCRAPGLVTAYQNAFSVELVVDGDVKLDGSVKATKPYWQPIGSWGEEPDCHPHPGNVVGAWWVYNLSGLAQEPGEHTIEWVAVQEHQVTDLLDIMTLLPDGTIEYVPDGKPDKYPADEYSFSTTLVVS